MAPYHPVGFEAGVDAATKGLSNVDVLGSLMQDLNQAAAAAVVVSLLALKSIFGRSSGVPGVSHVVVSSVLDSSSSSLEAVRSKFMYIKSLDPPKKTNFITVVYYYSTNDVIMTSYQNIQYLGSCKMKISLLLTFNDYVYDI